MVRKSLKLPGASSVFHSFAPEIGCTTVAHRVGKYLFAIRILDWPGHNSGGRFFLQIDRNICGTTRTIDLTVPVVQGALTVINQSGTFYEMNIAPGDQVGRARGMPAVFFNRLAAEMADNVDEMEQLLQTFQPLGPYHLTAINGVDARTYHFYLSDSERDQHEVEILLPDQTQPQILVVANNGLKHKDDKLVPVNHRDSDERKQNIYQFFSRERVRTALQRKIYEQADGKKLSKASIEEVLALNLECARLALVNNSESVCCMLGVYYEDQLIYARAAVDNLYAQSKDMADFKELTVPLFMSK